MEKKEPLYTVGGNVNWCGHCGKHYGSFLKTKNGTTMWPSNSIPGYISEKTKILIQKDTHTAKFSSVQFSSLAQLCPTPCNPTDCSMTDFPVHHQLPEPTQTHIHCVGDAIRTSHPHVIPFSSCLQYFPASGSFPMSQFFTLCGQSIGVSTSASVLPMNNQDYFL